MQAKDSMPQAILLEDYTPSEFLIDKTELKFELGEKGTFVSSKLHIARNPDADSTGRDELSLHAESMDVLEVWLDGQQMASDRYEHSENILRVKSIPDSFVLEIKVGIHPEDNSSLMGLYKSRTMFCTQCEAEGFRKITPYLDRPDVMSEFTTTIVADPEKYPVLLSNGNMVDEAILEDGRKQVTWEDPFRKPAYLFALVAGDLEHIEDSFTTCSGRDICIRIFVEEKDLDKCDHALRSLKASMKWDEETYGREYDLDIFMIVAVDDFNMGAMENKGLNIFNTSAVLANPKTTTDARFQWVEAVVAHEYFHNWSGNRVTCRDWFQLSLKEGFTVYRDSEFSSDLNSRTVKRVEDVRVLRAFQFAEDAGPLAHPVQPDSYMEINNFYTLTIYEKGCEVVRMQANLLGPELFRKGTDLYFERHDGQAVTIEDFVACMEEVSGEDLSQFKHWYKQAGTPELRVKSTYDEDAKTLVLDFQQSCPPTPESETKLPFLIPVRMGLVGESGDLPLYSDEAGLAGETDAVLRITEERQSLVFKDVQERPAVSLLRGFSAPVKLEIETTDADLLRLMRLDSDGFNRWDAGQRLAVKEIHRYQAAFAASQTCALHDDFVGAYRELLGDVLSESGEEEKAMVALMLVLPSMEVLAELEDQIDLDTLYSARWAVYTDLANALATEFKAVCLANTSSATYQPSASQIAQRSLKNVCLNYWLTTEHPEALDFVVKQFTTAANMTDQSSALTALVNSSWESAKDASVEALASFYEQWNHESLVVNQWFGIQAGNASEGGLSRVKELMQHPAFDLKNPNKARSVIGGFAGLNPHNFHNADGSGYAFLADQVLGLNAINPQIASRLVVPLTKWKKHTGARAELMRAQLTRISETDGLSSDVNELVTKSLL